MSTIVITGASSGLGAEMARQFAALGHDLGLCARRTDRLEELATELTARHPDRRVEVRTLDVTDHDRVFAVFEDLTSAFGRVDRFVVNAGTGEGGRLGTGRFEANRRTVETNFVAALAQVEAAAAILRRQGEGHLVVVSSVAALRGLPGPVSAYAASKAALAHLAEGFRADVVGTPIKVTVLYPGYIRTEMSGDVSTPLMVPVEKGVRAIVRAVEAGKPAARVPAWPWVPLGFVMQHLPTRVLRRFT